MRILVTGGTGFIGGHLCQRLTREGYSVRALVRDPRRCDDLRGWGVDLAPGDLLDLPSLQRATRDIDLIYHCAALFRQEASQREIWEANVQGTRNVLEAAVKAGVGRLVYCSSTGVHGNIGNPPANETTPYSPIPGDHYQASKIEAEQEVFRWSVETGHPCVVLRSNGVYGPRDTRFLKLFRAIKHRRFVMLGSGELPIHPIYVDDLVDGALLCGTHEKAIGTVYILLGAEAITLNQFVGSIAEAVGVPPPRLRFPVMPVYVAGILCEWVCKPLGIRPPLYRRRVNFFRMAKCFDISKARKELGFEPRVDTRTGIARTAEWYQSAGWL